MENFNKREANKIEGVAYKIKLTDHAFELAGRFIDTTIPELIKILAIIQHVQKNSSTVKDAEKNASDLFSEFHVKQFKYGKIFSPDSLFRILKSEPIKEIAARFHNVDLIIKNDSTVDSVMADYRAKTAEDPKEKAEREARRIEGIRIQQGVLDEMFADIDKVDFSNIEDVVDWLYAYVKLPIPGTNDHESEIIEKFKSHGYSLDKNNEMDAMLGRTLKDKKRYGEALVAYMLTNFGLSERGTELINEITEWKETFL